jgi:hypothetical protein
VVSLSLSLSLSLSYSYSLRGRLPAVTATSAMIHHQQQQSRGVSLSFALFSSLAGRVMVGSSWGVLACFGLLIVYVYISPGGDWGWENLISLWDGNGWDGMGWNGIFSSVAIGVEVK